MAVDFKKVAEDLIHYPIITEYELWSTPEDDIGPKYFGSLFFDASDGKWWCEITCLSLDHEDMTIITNKMFALSMQQEAQTNPCVELFNEDTII